MSINSILPNEILADVLQCLTEEASTSEWSRVRFVCRRWAALLERHLFAYVRLSYSFDLFNGSMSGSRVASFLNHLHRKPHLQQYVFELDIDVEKINQWICERVTEILDICTKLEKVALKFRLRDLDLPQLYTQAVNQRFLTILRKVATLKLKHLQLHGVSLETVMTVLDSAEIDHLSLDMSSWSGKMNDPLASGRHPSPDHSHLYAAYQRTGKIKRLTMSNVHESPKRVDLFLQWPQGLEAFRFRFVEYPWMSLFPTDALQIHQQTLKVLNLGYLSKPPDPCFLDLTGFSHLEVLCISGYDIVLRDDNVLPDCVYAPKLRRLEIHFDRLTTVALPETSRDALFDWDASYREAGIRRLATWFDFDHNCESDLIWPRTLRAVTVTYRCYQTRQLGAIYEPTPSPEPDASKWPEDWLEPAKKHGARLGFTVEYIGEE